MNDVKPLTDTEDAGSQPSSPALAARVALSLIGFYRFRLSPLTPPSCRFAPTCSHYTYDAIARFGLWRGGWLGAKRICRCHPWNPGGYDPVPETLELRVRPMPEASASNDDLRAPDGAKHGDNQGEATAERSARRLS